MEYLLVTATHWQIQVYGAPNIAIDKGLKVFLDHRQVH